MECDVGGDGGGGGGEVEEAFEGEEGGGGGGGAVLQTNWRESHCACQWRRNKYSGGVGGGHAPTRQRPHRHPPQRIQCCNLAAAAAPRHLHYALVAAAAAHEQGRVVAHVVHPQPLAAEGDGDGDAVG